MTESLMQDIPQDAHLISSILFLLVLARILGELANRIKQSPVVGEILAGIILGPAILGYIAPSEQLAGIAELSIFLILLSAGLEMDFKEIMNAFLGRGAILGAITFVLPMAAGIFLGIVLNLPATATIIFGLCIAITALPVIVRILSNFKELEGPIAQNAIAAAAFNDISALFLMGIILGLPAEKLEFASLFKSVSAAFGKFGVFALVIFMLFILFRWGSQEQRIQKALLRIMDLFGKESLFGAVILFALIIGALSEKLSSHFVIGVFFGGLLISRDVFGFRLFAQLEGTLNSISSGFLAPIFFAFIGLKFSFEPFTSISGTLTVIAVVFVSIASKLAAGQIGGRLAGLAPSIGMGVGVLINSRGTMDLVVAEIAFEKQFIDSTLFSTLVVLGVFSTVVTPVIYQQRFLKTAPVGNEEDTPEPQSPPSPSNSSSDKGNDPL